jgi:hypothetical protein
VDLDTFTPNCDRKRVNGLWKRPPFYSGETVELASVAFQISAAQLFSRNLHVNLVGLDHTQLAPGFFFHHVQTFLEVTHLSC